MTQKSKKQQVWDKAKEVRNKNPDAWRRDPCGNLMRRGSYGTQGEYGWEMDHKRPKSKGGSDSVSNLQAMNWKKNRELGDKS